MRKLFFIVSFALFIAACAGGGKTDSDNAADKSAVEGNASTDTKTYDPDRGEGKFTNVKIDNKLDAAMALSGEKIADLKCTSCFVAGFIDLDCASIIDIVKEV